MNNIIYEDNHLLVICKRAGQLSQADDGGEDSLLELGKQYLKEKYAKPGNVFLGLVHRLDRPVSGVILFARTSKAAARLSEQFRDRTVSKTYLAVVEGKPHAKSARLENVLEVDKRQRKTFVYAPSKSRSTGKTKAKKSILEYKTLMSNPMRTLLEVKLITGHKHQIRCQLANIGCPIAGDFKYGSGDFSPDKFRNGKAICLHAHTLEILHPTKKEPMIFTGELPKYWPDDLRV